MNHLVSGPEFLTCIQITMGRVYQPTEFFAREYFELSAKPVSRSTICRDDNLRSIFSTSLDVFVYP